MTCVDRLVGHLAGEGANQIVRGKVSPEGLECVLVLGVMLGPRRQARIAQALQKLAEATGVERDAPLVVDSPHQIHQPPAHDPMDGWDRSVLDQADDRRELLGCELGLAPRRMAVDQSLRPFGVEP